MRDSSKLPTGGTTIATATSEPAMKRSGRLTSRSRLLRPVPVLERVRYRGTPNQRCGPGVRSCRAVRTQHCVGEHPMVSRRRRFRKLSGPAAIGPAAADSRLSIFESPRRVAAHSAPGWRACRGMGQNLPKLAERGRRDAATGYAAPRPSGVNHKASTLWPYHQFIVACSTPKCRPGTFATA